MKQILTPDVLHLFEILQGQVRLVGGCVRDYLLNVPIHDWDMATPLCPQHVIQKLQSSGVKVVKTGLKHGTITAIIKGKPYEITTLRRDEHTDGRHAEVSFTDSYEQDARRRDFTINALYMDETGHIYDYTNGLQDIQNHLVRFIGNADLRIQEDYLRILRFFRFWGKISCGIFNIDARARGQSVHVPAVPAPKKNEKQPAPFDEILMAPIDAQALAGCTKFAPCLNRLSKERKRDELFKILTLDSCIAVLNLMKSAGVLNFILPAADIMALEAFLAVHHRASPVEKLAVLTSGLTPDLALSNAQKKYLAVLNRPYIPGLDLKQDKLTLAQTTPDIFAFYVSRALSKKLISPEMAHALAHLKQPIFPLKGRDLIEAGFKKGPQIKKALDHAQTIWADLDFPDNKKLVLERLLSYN